MECANVSKIVLYRGETAVVYAWKEVREMVEDLLWTRAERVAQVNKIGILVENLYEDVELDPKMVWQVRVKGRGVYQPVIVRLNGVVKVLSICFHQ